MKFIKLFIQTYIKSIKSAQFKNLKKELDKNLNIILEKEGIGAISGDLALEIAFKAFYTKLFLLFRHLNKLAAKGVPSAMAGGADSGVKKTSNYNPTASRQVAATPTAPKPAAPAQDDFQTRANMGSNLEESKKKKKYSKKASEFIGKEISHLKKDKGYPQDRAVAAAINVAKDKGMKVGTKKK
jgi:hypothetical protein